MRTFKIYYEMTEEKIVELIFNNFLYEFKTIKAFLADIMKISVEEADNICRLLKYSNDAHYKDYTVTIEKNTLNIYCVSKTPYIKEIKEE